MCLCSTSVLIGKISLEVLCASSKRKRNNKCSFQLTKPGSVLIISITQWEIMKTEEALVTKVLEEQSKKRHKIKRIVFHSGSKR